ncbi:MAG: O-antigen ligase family protein [Candidatus Saccharimonas sp.]|nr:O-antigen ligase family protein [Candidatus Saccharimonas sp.]
MKRLSIDNGIAWLLLAILAGLVIHAPLSVWLVSHGAPVWVKAWKELLMVVVVATMITQAIRTHQYVDIFRRSRLLQLIAAYSVLHLVMLLYSGFNLATLAGLMIDLRFVAYFFLVYIFVSARPVYRAMFVRVGIAGAALVTGFALMQVLLPHDALKYLGYSQATIQPYILLDENPAYVRMNSTLRGPNPLGAYVMIVVLGVVSYGMKVGRSLRKSSSRHWLHVLLLVGGVVALLSSYSRSAWLGLIAGMSVLGYVWYQKTPLRTNQLIAIAVFVLSLGCIAYGLRDTDFYKNVILHDNPTTGAAVTSDVAHAESLAHGLRRMAAQPYGAGIGSTGSASLLGETPLIIENQYLMVAHEVGWLGVIVFISVWAMVLWQLWLLRTDWLARALCASGVGLVVVSMMWPVLADDPVSMIWWGLAAVALVPDIRKKGAKHGTTTHKKTA